MRKFLIASTLFSVSAAAAFLTFLPRVAKSATNWNVPQAACSNNTAFSTWECPLASGSSFPNAALSGAFFDFKCPATGSPVSLGMTKLAFSGTTYSDSTTFICPGKSNQDIWLNASGVKNSPSQWDYLIATVPNAITIIGIAAVGTN